MLQAKLVREMSGHTNYIKCVTFSPDGVLLASSGDDNTVRLWAVSNGASADLKGHYDKVNSVCFSPNGQYLASASDDKSIRIWERNTRKSVAVLNGHTAGVTCVAWSPNGQQVASCSIDRYVVLWDVRSVPATNSWFSSAGSSIPRQLLSGHIDQVWALAFRSDGRKLASGGTESTFIWDLATGGGIKIPHGFAVRSLCFSPANVLAAACSDNIVRLFDDSGHELEAKFEGHTNLVTSVMFSKDGRFIASASEDNSVRLWRTDTSEQIQQIGDNTRAVCSVAISPSGDYIAAGGFNCVVRLWSLQVGQQTQPIGSTQRQPSVPQLQPTSVRPPPTTLPPPTIPPQTWSPALQDSSLRWIPMKQISITSLLSDKSNFGVVHKGLYRRVVVAIKEAKLAGPDLDPDQQRKDLEEEARIMATLPSDLNVLQYYGICFDPAKNNVLLVVEFCNLGNLEDYLKAKPQTSAKDRYQIILHVAYGLNHLAINQFVHRDIATRNVLLSESNGNIVAKIADFGLSRQLQNKEAVYTVTGQHMLSPETAPEVRRYGKHTVSADVWAFGLLMWEVESLCRVRANPNTQANPVLPKPQGASDALYEIMKTCWMPPAQRPGFAVLVDNLVDFLNRST